MRPVLFACLLACCAGAVDAAALDPDPAFGPAWSPGRAQIMFDLAGDRGDALADVAVAPGTQAVYTVGTIEIGDQRVAAALAKRLPDGSADTGFAVGNYSSGWMRFDPLSSTGLAFFHAVALQGDSAIFAAGWRHQADGRACAFVAKVLDTATQRGKLDGSFGTSGILTRCGISGQKTWFSDVKVLPDGRLLLAFNAGDTSALLRLLPGGQPDASFGSAGAHPIDVRPGKEEAARRIAVSAAGYYVAGDTQYAGSDFDAYVLRVTAAGARDTGFIGGVRIEALDDPDTNKLDTLADLTVDASGRPLLLVNSARRFTRVIRLTTLGYRDIGFGTNGLQDAALGHATTTTQGTDWPNGGALAINAAQQIWVVGARILPTPETALLAVGRLATNGAPIGSYAVFDYGFEEYGLAAAIAAQERVLIGTSLRTSLQIGDIDFGLLRLMGTP